MKSTPLLLLFSLSVAPSLLQAQTPADVLRKAMQAAGPWHELKSFSYRSAAELRNPWQAYNFANPQPNTLQGEYVQDLTQGRYRHRTELHYPGGYVFDFVNVGKDSTRYLYDRNHSRNGKLLLKQGAKAYLANQSAPTQSQPYFLLKATLASRDSLQYLPTTADGPTMRRYFKAAPGTQDLVFDKTTGLLVKTIRQNGKDRTERHFERYQKVHGLQVATRNRQVQNGKTVNEESITGFTANAPVPASTFDIPLGYTLYKEEPTKPLAAKEIAKDVYLIELVGGDRNVVFVNLPESVLVTEAPLSAAVTKAVLDVIHQTLPGKRIGYAHLSHHHNDHIGGVRQWVAEGATLLCTAPLEAPVRAILKGELGNVADDYAKNPKEPVFEFIAGVKTMQAGSRKVEFHAVPNSHAEGMSFVYLPAEGIIYEGDLLTVPEDGTLTPAIAVSKEFRRYLDQKKLSFSRIIGHHSYSAITPAQFETMLKTKKAVQAGLH